MTKKNFGKSLIIAILVCVAMISCGKLSGQNSTKFVYQVSDGKLKIDLFVPNLKNSKTYMLCLNGKKGQDGNEALCKSGGQSFGPECYIDFQTVSSDKQGNLSYTGTVSLRKSKYDVTFLIKDMGDNWKPIFIKDHCRFEIPQ